MLIVIRDMAGARGAGSILLDDKIAVSRSQLEFLDSGCLFVRGDVETRT